MHIRGLAIKLINSSTIYLSLSENPLVTIGSFAGYASVAYLIYKQFWKERPRLEYEIENKYWYPPDPNLQSKWYTISFEILFRNTGERLTTINDVSISFNYNNKSYLRKSSAPKEIMLVAGDSKTQWFTFSINEREIEIENNPTNVELKIKYTHKTKKEIIAEISKRS